MSLWRIACFGLAFGPITLSYAAEVVPMPHVQEEWPEHVHGAHFECPLPKVAQDVLRCAREEHPRVKKARIVHTQAQALPLAAAQIPNPEFESESGFGSLLGDTQVFSQNTLVQPIELGGKRDARVGEAKARVRQSEANLHEVKAEVVIETVTQLYRLQHLLEESDLLGDTIDVLTKILSQYESRPKLSPEQEVSKTVFHFAIEDARLKRTALFQRLLEVQHFFHVATGHSLDELRPVLPRTPESWPDLSRQARVERFGSPGFGRLLAEQQLAVAESELASANAWPTLNVGPLVLFQTQGAISYQQYGFQFRLPLPLFSLNQGAKAYAALGVERAAASLSLLEAEESHERAELLQIYRLAVESVRKAISHRQVDQKHQQIQKLFLRGLVSASLVIEAHRQKIDLIMSLHEQEQVAIQSLWRIYALDGRVLEESL